MKRERFGDHVSRFIFYMAQKLRLLWMVIGFFWLIGWQGRISAVSAPLVYLPIIMRSGFHCPTSSTNQYVSGIVYQHDLDNPVRPAANHADKNLDLRSYLLNEDPNLVRGLVDYGVNDPTQPPQLATLFNPYRVPDLLNFYRVYQWIWAPSPDPGTRGDPITDYPATALGMGGETGEGLYAPISGYDIGDGMEVIVLFADHNSAMLHYTREDSAAPGYTLHVDNICTDANLLALYNALDDPDGARYEYPSPSYNLPTLTAGQPFGTVGEGDVVVAVVDTGAFQDPRSCNDWWQIRPGTDCAAVWGDSEQ